MATGQANLSLSQLEQISGSKEANSVQLDDDESMASSKGLEVRRKPGTYRTLPEVWDDSYRKARKFIADVVAGADSGEKEDTPVLPAKIAKDNSKGNESVNNERLGQLCTQLREVLIDSNGVIEVKELAGLMSDFTDSEIDEMLTQLAAQDKIMLADGQIFRI